MGSTLSDRDYVPDRVSQSVKIVVLGAFGVGKTTYVRAVSEIRSMHTEERMTQAGEAVDDLSGVQNKTTTTVTMDFGRLTLTTDLVLYLFGAPGQDRFLPMVTQLIDGALGALVLVDTRSLDRSFTTIDLVEQAGLPYAIAVNAFAEAPEYEDAEIRDSLTMEDSTPLVRIDARVRDSAKQALIALISNMLGRPHLEPAP